VGPARPRLPSKQSEDLEQVETFKGKNDFIDLLIYSR
jgi:hypothetical protein